MVSNRPKILLGMSGGVDSSVAAYLLLKEGYDVVGITLEMYEDENCNNSKSINDAKNVCSTLNIPHYVFSVKNDFKKYILDYFISEYESGRTPNPCVVCNRYVKFEGLIQKAKELGIEYISTGHYAVIKKKKDRHLLLKGKDETKDQSYFLYNLTQQQLSKTVFPLGKYMKKEVRDIAKRIGLPTADKPDSQEICFIKNDDYRGFLNKNSKQKLPQGEFVDIDGNILGYHKGISQYTIGQRRNLGIVTGKAMFVLDIDYDNNQIILGSNENLFSQELVATNMNWILFDKLEKEMKVKAKVRYRAKESEAIITPMQENRVKVEFKSPQRAITKGQAIVFYKRNNVVGGGIIS